MKIKKKQNGPEVKRFVSVMEKVTRMIFKRPHMLKHKTEAQHRMISLICEVKSHISEIIYTENK